MVKSFKVVIIGGGITGSALYYLLSRYTAIGSVALLEKYDRLGAVNTHAFANSQTLHCGDIETNYTLEKAARVKQIASMIVNYARLTGKHDFLYAMPKMALGVGEEEVETIRQRHDIFKDTFTYLKLWDKRRIQQVEPAVAADKEGLRKEPIIASGCENEYAAVDFGRLAESFVEQATPEAAQSHVHLATKVLSLVKEQGGYRIKTDRGLFFADFVAVTAGAHSLLLAHQLGYGLQFGLLPIAGSFFYAPKMLNGKVYTVQNKKLPFAALHGDPDIAKTGWTRLGPTALILPKLERYRWGTYGEFLRVLRPDKAVLKVFWDLFKDPDIRRYMFRNVGYEIPFLGKRLFVHDIRKIIPAIEGKSLHYAHRVGGIRPQVIYRDPPKLVLGEATVSTDEGIIFKITPSPGASTCLGQAYQDALTITRYLGLSFERERLVSELLQGQDLKDLDS